MKKLLYIKIGVAAAIVLLIIAAVVWLRSAFRESSVSIGADDGIELTPTQIQSIKDIGEWEFLAVSSEEMVDTVRKGIFSDDELVRIYYGTLRIGINMHHVKPGWIKTSGDTVSVRLPRIGLLDNDFIDEARTKSFYESGTWQPKDKEALYRKAYALMRQHCLTRENLQTAQSNAELQFGNMMRSMGYKYVDLRFEN